jgi:hypothetical protein
MVDLADILQKDSLDKRELVNSIPAAVIVAELPLIFSSYGEDVACKGLDVLKLICEGSKEPGQARLMVSTALYAFENSSIDVHARALELLKRFALPLDTYFAEELKQRLDSIASSHRPTAEALLATTYGARKQSGGEFSVEADSLNLEELIAQYNSLDEHWRSLAGCKDALDAATGKKRLIPALKFKAKDVVRLDPALPFQPIRDRDELMDLMMRGLSGQLTEAEVERVLDAVAHTPPPPDGDYWEARLSALSARAKNSEGGFLAQVALAWAFGTQPEKDQFFEHLLHKRVVDVARQLATGRKVHLLATPTHGGFWIDARILVERARKVKDIDTNTTMLEQVQSLLCLAPDHHDQALSAAESLPGEFGCALRYALGSNKETFGENTPLWVAAIRARMPFTEPYCMKIKLKARDFQSINRCLSPADFRSEPAILIEEYLDPRPGTHEMAALIGDLDVGNIRSPLCTELFWARQFRDASENRESSNAYWQEDGWQLLYDPDQVVGGMTMHALVFALNAVCSEARSVSVKLLIRAIQDGRIDGVMLGTTIADHYSDILSTLWVGGLHEVAKHSPLHAQVVHHALEIILGQIATPDENPDSVLLRELLKLSIKIDFGIASDTARNYLDALGGADTAKDLAKELLDYPIDEDSGFSREAGLIALQERIKRATRWQAWHNATLDSGAVS